MTSRDSDQSYLEITYPKAPLTDDEGLLFRDASPLTKEKIRELEKEREREQEEIEAKRNMQLLHRIEELAEEIAELRSELKTFPTVRRWDGSMDPQRLRICILLKQKKDEFEYVKSEWRGE